jgi:hypothetical protein
MKNLACLLIVLALCSRLSASGASNPQELIGVFDRVVELGSKWNVPESMGIFKNAKRVQVSPKDGLEATDRIKDLFAKIREGGIGPVLQTNRISVVYFGDAFCRVRYLNVHDKGYLLWTFYGERLADSWYAVALSISANSDFEDLATEKLYPSDASKELVQP